MALRPPSRRRLLGAGMWRFVAFALLLALLPTMAHASSSGTTQKVRAELINRMAADGYLTPERARDAMAAYVDVQAIQSRSWLSMANFVKLTGTLFLLVAFHGVLLRLAESLWFIIIAVPLYLYQVSCLQTLRRSGVSPAALACHCVYRLQSVRLTVLRAHGC